VLAALAALSDQLTGMEQELAALLARVPPQPWPYTGRFKFFGITTTEVGQIGE
jgi:hypothetical protein